jgi:hypothetical protein
MEERRKRNIREEEGRKYSRTEGWNRGGRWGGIFCRDQGWKRGGRGEGSTVEMRYGRKKEEMNVVQQEREMEQRRQMGRE